MAKRRKQQLSKSQKKRLLQDIRNYLGQGYSDIDICEKMNLRIDAYKSLKLAVYQQDKMRFQELDSYQVYSDYCMRSSQLLKELDEVRTKFRNRGQWAALVAAIKQKKDINDSVIKLGQDFGFIEKKATEMKIEGSMSFATMSDEDVKQQIEEEVQKMHRIAKGEVIEMRPELLGVTDDDVKSYIPANLLKAAPKQKKTKVKHKIKVTLKKRIRG